MLFICLFKAESCHVEQAGLQLAYVTQIGLELATILMPQFPECWITTVSHHAQFKCFNVTNECGFK